MPDSVSHYCVLAIHWADKPEQPEFLALEGKVVLFDTLFAAQSFVPRLFAGRLHRWDAERETLFALEFAPDGFNRLSIWKNYDPYDVPNGFRAKGVWSEAAGRDWKHHIPYFHQVDAITAWADHLEAEREMRLQAIGGRTA